MFALETDQETQRKFAPHPQETLTPNNMELKFPKDRGVTGLLDDFFKQANLLGLKLLPDDKNWLKAICIAEPLNLLEDRLNRYIEQKLLVIQLLSTHSLQQDMIMYAKNSGPTSDIQHTQINAATKLSNLFVAQVSLLQKLKAQSTQGNPGTVHVHEGAQAVVGTVNCYGGQDDKNRK